VTQQKLTRRKRSTLAESEYYYDEVEAERAVGFFPDCLVHVKGALANKPFELMEWQKKIVRELFGWKRAGGFRKYRKAYIEIPRKNGKSTFAAGIAIYLLLCDHEEGAEVYSAASTRDQASLVYSMAAEMLRKSPMLSKHVKIRDSVKRVIHPKTNSFYRAIAADADAAHGFNAHGIIFDEVHTQPDRDLWDVLDTSTGARQQPLTIAITTAGHDKSSICWELHKYAKAVKAGEIADESFYPVIFGAEAGDDWNDEAIWEKANPCLDQAVSRDYLREQAARAEENPAFENTFRRLHLNQWTEQESRIIQMAKWDACKKEYLPEDLHGRACYGGLDLSSTRDVTAFVLVFPEEGGGCRILPWFWIPEQNVDSRAGSDQRLIRNYATRGEVELTDGNEVDVLYLADRIFEICQEYDVQYIGFDPWNSSGVTQLLKDRGLPEHVLMKMPQTFGTYNEPFKTFLGWIGNGKFQHNGNDVMRWMAANVAHKEDASGNIRPDKGKSAEKIDGICSMLMGIALATHYGNDFGIYSTSGSGVILF
jgi:phage terminase large subunit-like protein